VPGPQPATPRDRRDLWPRPGEDLCHLAGDWRILQRLDGHRWSLDDLVTAWFATEQVRDARPSRVADLGCGIGAVLMLIAWRFPQARCVGVEAQPVSVARARRSLAWNGVAGRCEVKLADLRAADVLPDGVFDLVTGTPPYLRPGTATESERVQRAPCHFEHRGGIEAYCAAAARLMAPRGCFVTCAAAAQVQRVHTAACATGLRIVRRREVVPRAGKRALFSVYAMERARVGGSMVVEAPLVVREANGGRTEAFRALRLDLGMPP